MITGYPSRRVCAKIAPLIAAAFLGMTVPPLATAMEENNLAFETTDDLIQVCATPAADPAHVLAQTACTAFIEATLQWPRPIRASSACSHNGRAERRAPSEPIGLTPYRSHSFWSRGALPG
jgi:hypothetical protein